MRDLRWLFCRLRNLWRPQAREAELDAELQFHIDTEAEEQIAAGLPADSAREEARRWLKAGRSISAANVEIAARPPLRDPNSGANRPVGARLLLDHVVRDSQRVLGVFFGAVTCVLLIGVANLVSLQLVRNTGRERELGLRTALGASRWRLIRQSLVESLLLSAPSRLGSRCPGYRGRHGRRSRPQPTAHRISLRSAGDRSGHIQRRHRPVLLRGIRRRARPGPSKRPHRSGRRPAPRVARSAGRVGHGGTVGLNTARYSGANYFRAEHEFASTFGRVRDVLDRERYRNSSS